MTALPAIAAVVSSLASAAGTAYSIYSATQGSDMPKMPELPTPTGAKNAVTQKQPNIRGLFGRGSTIFTSGLGAGGQAPIYRPTLGG